MVGLTLNFVGVNAADFRRAVAFYTETLGLEPPATSSPDDAGPWAMLVAGWDETPVPTRRGLRCELFERDVESQDRWWRGHQNVRPSIQVADLPAIESTLRVRGVSFPGERTDTEWGTSIEFAAPEDVRWSLAHAPDYPAGRGLQPPYLGWVTLQTADLAGQLSFYTGVMGLSVGDRSGTRVRLEQGGGNPMLFLELGGERVAARGRGGSPFAAQPVWLSFETSDVDEAAAWLHEQGVTIHQGVTAQDWGGTDLVVADADGNPVQVVEYTDT